LSASLLYLLKIWSLLLMASRDSRVPDGMNTGWCWFSHPFNLVSCNCNKMCLSSTSVWNNQAPDRPGRTNFAAGERISSRRCPAGRI
jgi:hypothetical protein